MVFPPCKKNGVHCTKRYVGCHDRCPEFKEFKDAVAKEKAAILKQKKAERDIEGARAASAFKSMKAQHRIKNTYGK